jgi:hypothetical protein
MRKFSELEKSYIKHLVKKSDYQSNFPINILDGLFVNRKVVFDAHKEDEPYLIFYRKENEEFSLPAENNAFMELALLIRYLKDQGLIQQIDYKKKRLIYPPVDEKDDDTLENYKREGLHSIAEKMDKIAADFLLECVNKSVFVGQTLKDLVDNDFKSIEERSLDEVKKQTKYARKAVYVAIFAMILSVVLSKCSVTLDEKQNLFKRPINVKDSVLIKNQSDFVIPNIKEINEIVHEIRLNQKSTVKK